MLRPMPDCWRVGAIISKSPKSSSAAASATSPGESIPSSFVSRISGLSIVSQSVQVVCKSNRLTSLARRTSRESGEASRQRPRQFIPIVYLGVLVRLLARRFHHRIGGGRRMLRLLVAVVAGLVGHQHISLAPVPQREPVAKGLRQ